MNTQRKIICLILLAFLFFFTSVVSFKIDSQQQTAKLTENSILPNLPLNTQDIQKGSSITSDISDFFKKQAQMSYLVYRYDTSYSVYYINQKLKQAYPGSWMICMIRSPKNGTSVVPTKDFNIATSSWNGTWWYYAKGLNHLWPEVSYFFTKIVQKDHDEVGTYYEFSSSSAKYGWTYFSNIVTGIQQDISDFNQEASLMKATIETFNTTFIQNVIVGNQVLFNCGMFNYYGSSINTDSVPSSTKNKFQIGSFIRSTY